MPIAFPTYPNGFRRTSETSANYIRCHYGSVDGLFARRQSGGGIEEAIVSIFYVFSTKDKFKCFRGKDKQQKYSYNFSGISFMNGSITFD